MDTEDPTINYRTKGQVVKYLATVSPYIGAAVLARAFVVEAVDLRDLPRFVIASDQCYAIRVADLVCQKEKKCLHAVEPSVNKVAWRDAIEGSVSADGLRNAKESE